MSIRLKITLWYSSLVALMLVLLGVGIYIFVTLNTYRDVKAQIESSIDNVQVITSDDKNDQLDFQIGGGPIDGNVFIQIVDYTNGSLVQSRNLIETDLQFPYAKKGEDAHKGYSEIKMNGYQFLIYSYPVTINKKVVALVQSAAYTGREVKYLNDLRNILIVSFGVVLILTFTTGLFIAQRALHPLKKMIQTANRIQDGSNLSVRIERGSPNDEIGKLTDTLNGMLGRIESTYNELDEAYQSQRRFVSDASHELRTPLTTIRGNIELLQKMSSQKLDEQMFEITQEAMQDIAEEARRMTQLVSDLLSLARADAGYKIEKHNQPLLPIIEEVVRRAFMLPRTAEWTMGDFEAIRDVEISANADSIRQLLFIFIENAFKYTPSGKVEISTLRSHNQAGIVIKDTGIGMNSAEIPHIFDRFYRADESRGKTSGTGLGLSIAKWIIDEHQGSVEVSTREGEGTTFTVWLPITFLDNSNQL